MVTEQQKRYLKEHLPYTLKMLRYTGGQIIQRQHYLSWNAHFESFAVHARNSVAVLTNGDKSNLRALDFVKGYRARIGDTSGAMTKLRQQVFHLEKERPTEFIGKFNTQHAKAVADWIEDNFKVFLSRLPPELRRLFDEKMSDPTKDGALYLTVGPTGPGAPPTACTASPVAITTTIGGS